MELVKRVGRIAVNGGARSTTLVQSKHAGVRDEGLPASAPSSDVRFGPLSRRWSLRPVDVRWEIGE